MPDGGYRRSLPVGAVALAALFVTALVTAQVTAAKLIAVPLPASLPVVGASILLPGASVAYPLTFFASDCYSELYGPEEAHKVVNVGFAMNFVLLALVYSTIAAPAAPFSPIDPATFQSVLGASLNIVVASLLAYLVSQHWDVRVFHKIREWTDGDRLWVRNVGSTATSQLLDTLIFVSVGFAIVPALRGGDVQTVNQLLGLALGQYLLKLLIAFADTPLVYAAVGFLRSRGSAAPAPRSAD